MVLQIHTTVSSGELTCYLCCGWFVIFLDKTMVLFIDVENGIGTASNKIKNAHYYHANNIKF